MLIQTLQKVQACDYHIQFKTYPLIGIVDRLHECNMEVFNGYENHKVNTYFS